MLVNLEYYLEGMTIDYFEPKPNIEIDRVMDKIINLR